MRFHKLPPPLRAYLLAYPLLVLPLVWRAWLAPAGGNLVLAVLLVLAGVLFCAQSVEVPTRSGRISLSYGIVCLALLFEGTFSAVVCAGLAAIFSTYARAGDGIKLRFHPQPAHRTYFNLVNCSFSCSAAGWLFELLRGLTWAGSAAAPIALLAFTGVYFVLNTLGVALALALSAGKRWLEVWRESFAWTWAGFFASASVAGLLYGSFHAVGAWSLLLLPPLFLPLSWYRLYVDRFRLLAEKAEQDRLQIQQLSLRNQELEGLNQAIVQASPVAVCSLDAQGTVLSWNPAAERLFGWTAAEAVGSPFPTALVRDGAELDLRLDSREAQQFETRTRLRDGRLLDVEIILGTLQAGANERAGLVLVARDLTERRQAELAERRAHLGALIENSADVIAVLDERAEVRYVSPAAERLWGYAAGALQGRPFCNLVHTEDRDTFTEALVRRLSAGGAARLGEARLAQSDGEWRVVEVFANNLLAHPQVSGVVLTVRDVTERKALEQRLLHAEKMEAIGRLAGGIAHDFNNMLAVINGYTELLLSEPGTSEFVRSGLTQVHLAGDRAAHLTRQLLAFSRKQVLAPQVLRLESVVGTVETMLRRLLRENIELVVQVDPTAGCVSADPTQLEQVLLNLALNARDAMPLGGQLRIVARNATPADLAAATPEPQAAAEYVTLEVSDTGVGMTPETMKRVWEPFFTTKDVGQGTGLGLASVYGTVSQSEGRVGVASRPGEGTTFTILLPRVRDASVPKAEVPSLVPLSGSETILLAEDEPQLRELLADVLTGNGYHVLAAGSGEEALDLAAVASEPIHLLLTDVVMPGIGGGELAARLRARNPMLPVLYTSGHIDDAALRQLLSRAEAPLIQKPCSPVEITRRVREALDTRP